MTNRSRTVAAYLVVTHARSATVVYRANGGRVCTGAVGAQRLVRLAAGTTLPRAGLYRCQVTLSARGSYVDEVSTVLDARAELETLDARAAGRTRANTDSPGVQGYDECRRMSQSAANNRRRQAALLAAELRSLLA